MGVRQERNPKGKLDPLHDAIDAVLKDPDGRFSAKQASAVLFAANQVANGVPTEVAVETGRGIMKLQGRAVIKQRLKIARSLARHQ